MSSIAQTLLSTIPVPKNRSLSVFSLMSVSTPELCFGQAIQIDPSAGSIVMARWKLRSASAALSAKIRKMSAGLSR